MKVIVEAINLELTPADRSFIRKKAEVFLKLEPRALYAEFNISKQRTEFYCRIILNLPGKDITVSRSADDLHFAVLKVIDITKRNLRRKKTKKIGRRNN